MDATEQQIIVTGGLLSITLFEEKLMKNFFIINSRLKKLQALNDLQGKTRNIEKQLKFLTVKVDTMVDKLPKQGHSISKKDVQSITKDQIVQLFNNSEQKIKDTKTVNTIYQQIQKLRSEIKNSQRGQGANSGFSNTPVKPTSFTAGNLLLSQSKRPSQASKQLLGEVLNKEQNKIVSSIIDQKSKQLHEYHVNDNQQMSDVASMKKDIQKLYSIIENMKVGKGYQHFIQKQIQHYDKFQRNEDNQEKKGRRKGDKSKNKQAQQHKTLQEGLPLVKQRSSSIVKIDSSNLLDFEKKDSKMTDNLKSDIVKHDLLARKTFNSKNSTTLLTKQQLSIATNKQKNKLGELTKVQYNIPENKLVSKAQRAKSLKKLQRIQKKLRVDDSKDLNTVLKEIQLRLQNKVTQQLFNNYILQFQEKLEILRITKDPTSEMNDIRKMIYSLDSKLQYVITFIQNSMNEDDALIVKKNWTCISCDKMVEKFNGKTGQHLNWDSVSSKKMSPTKAGAFGQTGQLASKIKNLMDYQGE